MKSLKLIPLLAAFAAVAAWQVIFANAIAVAATNESNNASQPPPQRPGPMLEHLLPPRIVDDLNLTADQRTKYTDLEVAFRKEAQGWRKEHPANPEEFRKARDTGDTEAMNKFRENRKQLMDIRKKYMDQFRASLTADQKKTLEQRLPEPRIRRGPGGPGLHEDKAGAPPSPRNPED